VQEAAQKLADGTIDEYRALYQRHGLVPGGWGLPVDFRKDDATLEQGLAALEPLARAAAAMRCPRVGTWVLPFSDELPYKDQFELLRKRFARIASALARHGCRLALEFVGPKPVRAGHRHEFIYRMDQMLDLCKAIGTGNVGLLLDSYHWHTSGGTVAELRALRNEDVVYVHVNDAAAGVAVDELPDSPRRLPGETGAIDMTGFLGALKAIGYDGPVTPEPFDASLAELPPDDAAEKVAAAMDKVWRAARV